MSADTGAATEGLPVVFGELCHFTYCFKSLSIVGMIPRGPGLSTSNSPRRWGLGSVGLLLHCSARFNDIHVMVVHVFAFARERLFSAVGGSPFIQIIDAKALLSFGQGLPLEGKQATARIPWTAHNITSLIYGPLCRRVLVLQRNYSSFTSF